MRLTLERSFPAVWDRAHRFVIRRLVKSYEPYHPVYLGNQLLAAGERACVDRWSLIADVVRSTSSTSLLDLGCAEGYFVQQAAKTLKCFSLGVDADIRRLTVARLTTSLSGINGAGFVGGTIDQTLLAQLPASDIVLFLSVLHHITYEHGIEYARGILTAIRGITKKRLVFDMGQSNETSHEWAKLLPKMEPDPQTWITNLLISAGFSNVEVRGETDAYKSEARRILFIAQP
jgi:SAM-dependent methyltransferase